MYKQIAKTKWFTVFLLFFPFLILSSLQQEAFSKTHDESLEKIQWHAVRNTNSNEKYAKAGDIVLMGAFATSVDPRRYPYPLNSSSQRIKNFIWGLS